MRTPHRWIAMVLVAALVGMASRSARAEGASIASPVQPLSPRYLPQTLAPVEPGGAWVRGTVGHAQVAIPGPGTRLTGSHASLKAWMWAGVVVGVLAVAVMLTIPRD